MANEYVLVQKRKLEQMEKDAKAEEDRGGSDADVQPNSTPPKPRTVKSTTSANHQGAGTSDEVAPSHTHGGGHRSQYSARPKLKLDNFPQRGKSATGWDKFPPYPHKTWPSDTSMDVDDDDDDDQDDADDASGDDDNDFDVVDILQNFTSAELSYVQPILKKMEPFFNPLTWIRKTGEIVLQHKVVDNSNIVELLKDTLTGDLHPVGKMEFYRGLDLLNVKLGHLKNQKSKALLGVMQGQRKVDVKPPKSKVKRLKPVGKTSEWLRWK